MLTTEQLTLAAAELADAERAVTDMTGCLAAGCYRLERTAHESSSWWTGPRSDRFRSTAATAATPIAPVPRAINDATNTIGRSRRLAVELAARLDEIDRERDRQVDLLLRVRRDVDETWSRPGSEQQLVGTIRSLDRQRVDVETRWSAGAVGASEAIARVASSLPNDLGSVRFGDRSLGAPGSLLPGLLPGRLAARIDPTAVAQWWDGLSNAARRAVIQTIPAIIGNLDGIPFADRASANRRSMQRALDDALPGSSQWAAMQQFADRTDCRRIDPLRRFVVFDPSGDGMIAELFGDITTADHIAVMVPGMGATLANFHDFARRGARLHRASGSTSAVIAWTGYDTPHAPAASLRALEVVSDRQAAHGGERLDSFADGVSTQSNATLTLIGHSYGSLTVGKALMDGARADRVVFTGSPGVGVDDVREFGTGEATEYFASEIKGDIVAELERFGSNPTDPDFGASVFDSGDGNGLDPVARHGEYFDDGVAIENLAMIVTGGSPTPGRTDLIEFVTEPIEDVDDLVSGFADQLRRFDLPLVDDTVIDRVALATQRYHETIGQVREIALEEAGHFGQDAVEWGVERAGALAGGVTDGIGDAWERGFDVVTGWTR